MVKLTFLFRDSWFVVNTYNMKLAFCIHLPFSSGIYHWKTDSAFSYNKVKNILHLASCLWNLGTLPIPPSTWSPSVVLLVLFPIHSRACALLLLHPISSVQPSWVLQIPVDPTACTRILPLLLRKEGDLPRVQSPLAKPSRCHSNTFNPPYFEAKLFICPLDVEMERMTMLQSLVLVSGQVWMIDVTLSPPSHCCFGSWPQTHKSTPILHSNPLKNWQTYSSLGCDT